MATKSFCSGNHILIGLGGTGGKILRAFKMRMFEEFPTAEERKNLAVSLLYVDSTDEMMLKEARQKCRVMGQDASFTNNEFFNIKDVDVEHILDHISNYPSVKGIVNNVGAVKSAIGSLGQAAGQKKTRWPFALRSKCCRLQKQPSQFLCPLRSHFWQWRRTLHLHFRWSLRWNRFGFNH